MKNSQLYLLISMIMVGISFLAEGMDRGLLILIGITWFIMSVIKLLWGEK